MSARGTRGADVGTAPPSPPPQRAAALIHPQHLAPPETRPERDRCTCGLEDVGVAVAVASGKGLHHAVNLLGFSREPKAPQKLAEGGRGVHQARWSQTFVSSILRKPTQYRIAVTYPSQHQAEGWGTL